MSEYCYMKDPCPICGGKMIDPMEYHKPTEPTCEPGDCQHVDEAFSRLRASLAAVTKEKEDLAQDLHGACSKIQSLEYSLASAESRLAIAVGALEEIETSWKVTKEFVRAALDQIRSKP